MIQNGVEKIWVGIKLLISMINSRLIFQTPDSEQKSHFIQDVAKL